MGLLDKAKQAAEQAATKAREGVEDVQAKRELGQAYHELGKATYELVESGGLTEPRLDVPASRVRTALEKVGAHEATDGDGTYDATQPPAMPT